MHVWKMLLRYQHAFERIFGPSLVFLSPPAAVISNHSHRHWMIEVSPRLVWAEPFERLSLARRLSDQNANEMSSRLVSKAGRQPIAGSQTCDFARMVFDRTAPQEPTARGRRGEQVAPWWGSARPPLLRVFSRPSAPTMRGQAEALALANSVVGSRSRPCLPSAQPPGAPSQPSDMARLADQVLEVIDRKIVAQRERFGRL